ncbi:GNAT family N-acetyltransferase [Bacillus nakamurai]|uniref:Streptothricin acetyltransferase n=1 Tax=Bacillus nakamurai TaxID=1793963 RepID=A0A150F5C1_9BACI|nr:GNAT family N-acetyltransferase [Bacillus nakamurai]KXZ13715.1 streptothricin acetyltransferase [Bacillus nakamurai]MED1227332.1 GNAT family N-acetyltransferase [Bacillus nakamurai]
MNLTIRKLTKADQDQLIEIDDRFTVDSILVLSMENNKIHYTIENIPCYEKSYKDDEQVEESPGFPAYIDYPDQAVYGAYIDGQLAGQVTVKRNWNEYAYIEDIKIDKKQRRQGIGRKLIEQVIQWAKKNKMPGIMLETQNINVKACQFYESCGFEIGGFDLCLYKGINKHAHEAAVYWYLIF